MSLFNIERFLVVMVIVMCGSGNDAVWRVCCSGIVRFSNGFEMVSVIFQRVQGWLYRKTQLHIKGSEMILKILQILDGSTFRVHNHSESSLGYTELQRLSCSSL